MNTDDSAIPDPGLETGADDAPAWQEIAAGRYQPRRIRGSLRGRELG